MTYVFRKIRSEGIKDFFETLISDFMPDNLELKNDTIYNVFFAFDAQGNICMFAWENGLTENQANFEYDLCQDATNMLLLTSRHDGARGALSAYALAL